MNYAIFVKHDSLYDDTSFTDSINSCRCQYTLEIITENDIEFKAHFITYNKVENNKMYYPIYNYN